MLKALLFVGKGTLSRDFLLFGMKNALKFELNAFSRTQNTPRTSRERNHGFLKKRKSIVSFRQFLQETKEKRENISLMFSSCNPFPY